MWIPCAGPPEASYCPSWSRFICACRRLVLFFFFFFFLRLMFLSEPGRGCWGSGCWLWGACACVDCFHVRAGEGESWFFFLAVAWTAWQSSFLLFSKGTSMDLCGLRHLHLPVLSRTCSEADHVLRKKGVLASSDRGELPFGLVGPRLFPEVDTESGRPCPLILPCWDSCAALPCSISAGTGFPG